MHGAFTTQDIDKAFTTLGFDVLKLSTINRIVVKNKAAVNAP